MSGIARTPTDAPLVAALGIAAGALAAWGHATRQGWMLASGVVLAVATLLYSLVMMRNESRAEALVRGLVAAKKMEERGVLVPKHKPR